jgi:hypothetical protein
MRPLSDPDRAAYTEAQVALARRAWPMKAAQELRSATVFSELQRCALLLGLPLDMAMAFSRAAQDELAHAEICTRVGEQLGADGPSPEMRSVETRFAAHPDTRRRFLALLLAETAVGETLSCALFRSAVRFSREPLTRSALSLILADEALHARLGWKALSWVLDSRELVEVPFLRDEVRRHLQWIEQALVVPSLRRLEAKVPFDPALAELGVLDPAVRVDTIYRVLEVQVVPALDALGLDGSRSWRERYGRR